MSLYNNRPFLCNQCPQSFNSLSQGPCTVAAFLMAVCSNGGQHIVPLFVKLCVRCHQLEQHFRSLPCLPSDHTLVPAVKTMTIYANAIQSHTILSVPVMHVRESRGSCASIPSVSLARHELKHIQVLSVDHQLHLGCSSWNVNSTSPPRLFEPKPYPSASLNLSQWGHEYQIGHILTQL